MNEDAAQLRRGFLRKTTLGRRVESQARQAFVYPGFPAQPVNRTTLTVKKTSHGWTVGQLIRMNSSGVWVLATSNDASTFIVESIINANAVNAVESGYIGTLSGLSAGTAYYNDGTGTLTATLAGKPMLFAISNTEGIYLPFYGEFIFPAAVITVLTSGTTINTAGFSRLFIWGVAGGGGSGSAPGASTILGYVATSSGGSPGAALTGSFGASSGGTGGFFFAVIDVSGLSSVTIAIGAAGINFAIANSQVGGTTSVTVGGDSISVTGGRNGGNGTPTEPGAAGNGGGVSITPGGGRILQFWAINGASGSLGLFYFSQLGSTAGVAAAAVNGQWPFGSGYGSSAGNGVATAGQGAIAYALS